ncbi:MAG: ATP-dependent dethiobiotin synthetase BioD 1 [Gammaproteobacteria bacterium]|nr:ATP-dependent dethiobiotin synthetase BioD 1 [Gammaproteobacteria bacterium]
MNGRRADGVFVTGTDTGIGKTYASVGLLRALSGLGCRTAAMKPVASGAQRTPAGLRNDDALALQAAAAVAATYEEINPYCFEPPIAPHIAAPRAGVTIDLDHIDSRARRLRARADFILVEGVGGWRVPLGPHLEVGDLAGRLGLPVLLVVGLRLGCISHALLTAAAISQQAPGMLGWVANGIDPHYGTAAETVQALTERLGMPPLAALAWEDLRGSSVAPMPWRAAAERLLRELKITPAR